jgi:hypothetical protein
VVVAVSDDLIYLFVHGEFGVKVGTEVTNTFGGSNDRFANADSGVLEKMLLAFGGEYYALGFQVVKFEFIRKHPGTDLRKT